VEQEVARTLRSSGIDWPRVEAVRDGVLMQLKGMRLWKRSTT